MHLVVVLVDVVVVGPVGGVGVGPVGGVGVGPSVVVDGVGPAVTSSLLTLISSSTRPGSPPSLTKAHPPPP